MDMSSATRVDLTWQNNSLTSFPAIDFPICTNFNSTWKDNNLTTFPALNMSSATNTTSAWQNNSLTSFSAIDMPLTTTVRAAWAGNNLDSFPDIDLSSCLDMEVAFSSNGIISSFSLRNFYSMTDGQNMLFGSTIPTSDWSDILITQNANNTNNNVNFHGGNSEYDCLGSNARDNLVNTKLWSITDGGLDPLVNCDFTIRVKTDNAGVSASNQYTIDFRGVNNVNVDWGDGSAIQNVVTSGVDNLITHTFPSAGEYDIKISGTEVEILNQNAFTDVLKILEIKNWGTLQHREWDRFMFSCSNLVITATDTPTYSIGGNSYRAYRAATLVDYNFGDFILTSTDRREMFWDSGMSTANYTDTIVGWANQEFEGPVAPFSVNMSSQNGMTFDTSRSGGANFATAGDARTYLISTLGWTITGDTVI
jgi:hypothetical protein